VLDENDLRCATGTSGPLAQIKRKPSANQRANHFPKDVRYITNGAQTILPWRANHFAWRANHFAWRASHFAVRRKSFW
jgi:hypothetical protein